MLEGAKNTYELRIELLRMSLDILESQSTRRLHNSFLVPKEERKAVEHYPVSSVIDLATQLSKFVGL